MSSGPRCSGDWLKNLAKSAMDVVTPDFGGETYGGVDLPTGDDSALGMTDFSLFPHLDDEKFPENSLDNAERWAAKAPAPTYAIDDQTAMKVTGGAGEVVSEGHWKLFNS
jgi:dipeptidase E